LRGSGRFAVATRRGSATPHAGAAALRPYHYPLHCGAVVASCVSPRTPGIFASGLNPLHCGAVVASHERLPPNQRRYRVSIPFIAGQWSLHGGDAARQRHAPRGRSRAAPLSLSPSLRGSGRFVFRSGFGYRGTSLNPLHCGAVVASPHRRSRRRPRRVGLNPLHCGAVVASKDAEAIVARLRSFNPLHCGAVVASDRRRTAAVGGRRVSIPFIAGQWSLRQDRRPVSLRRRGFNPLHCGAVVASRPLANAGGSGTRVSIPFIAGQWSLRRSSSRISDPLARFNPLHCGAVVASP